MLIYKIQNTMSTNRGISMIYNGHLQGGDGRFTDFVKKGLKWAKDNKLVSKIGAVSDAVGATDYLNKKTGGKFGQAVDFGKSKGYGRRTVTRTRTVTRGGARRKRRN